jgi:hypothetical protein
MNRARCGRRKNRVVSTVEVFMQGADWVSLFQLIPAEQHNSLYLVIASGLEVAVQSILRLEASYLVLRGRPAGTTDTGRVFFVPYDNIAYLGFQNPVSEAEVRALYGEPAPEATSETPPSEDAPPAETTEQAAPSAAAETPPSAPTPVPQTTRPSPRPSVLGKNSILERLRARSQAGGPAPRPPADR